MNLAQFLILTNPQRQSAPPSGITYISTVVYSGYSSMGTKFVPIPGTAVAGDSMLVLFDSATGGVGSVTTPDGWDIDVFGASPIYGGSCRSYALIKYLTATDISNGSVSVTFGGSNATANVIFLKGTASVDTFNATSTNNMGAPVNISAPSITTYATSTLLIFHAAAYKYGLTTAPTMSTPTGFTLAQSPVTPTYTYAMSAYASKSLAGSVPSAQTNTNIAATADTNGIIIALKA